MTAYHRYIGLTIVIIAFVGALFAMNHIDGPIPVHWNAEGKVDGWSDSPWSLLLLPGVMLGLFVVFQAIEWMSPQGFRVKQFRNVVGVFQNAILLFMSLVLAAQILYAGGIDVRMDQLVFFGIGVLFIVIGNFLGKTRKNFFIGIRTPWTLASDEVWNRTHRLGGWCFVIAGFVMLFGGTVTTSMTLMIVAVVTAALVPVVYSLVLYMKLEGFKDSD